MSKKVKTDWKNVEGAFENNAVINFCHDHPPPAHPRGFALKALPHSGAFGS